MFDTYIPILLTVAAVAMTVAGVFVAFGSTGVPTRTRNDILATACTLALLSVLIIALSLVLIIVGALA